jgi:hypothetical protein
MASNRGVVRIGRLPEVPYTRRLDDESCAVEGFWKPDLSILERSRSTEYRASSAIGSRQRTPPGSRGSSCQLDCQLDNAASGHTVQTRLTSKKTLFDATVATPDRRALHGSRRGLRYVAVPVDRCQGILGFIRDRAGRAGGGGKRRPWVPTRRLPVP